MPNSSKIAKFWKWFQLSISSEDVFSKDSDFIDSLTKRVTSLGGLSWEIGPGVISPENWAFVLSPGGDRNLLKLTETIVQAAPKIDGWEFYATKPPKSWQMRFTVEDDSGNEIEVDASKWRYVIQRHNRAYAVLVNTQDIPHLTNELKRISAGIFVEGEIGEEMCMMYIDSIVVVERFDSDLEACSNSTKVFRQHFTDIVSGRE